MLTKKNETWHTEKDEIYQAVWPAAVGNTLTIPVLGLMDRTTIATWWVIAGWPHHLLMNYDQIEELVNTHLERLNEQQRAWVFEAAALSAYYSQTQMPIMPLLLSNDAPQFKSITDEQTLCWVHEGRHYKKLTPYLEYHRQLLDDFRAKFWEFYRKLQRYRASPSPQQATAKKLKVSFFAYIHDRASGANALPVWPKPSSNAHPLFIQ